MIHIKSKDGTLCGIYKDIDNTVYLAIPVSCNDDALTIRRRLDTIADQSNCPECRIMYVKQ